MSNITLGYARVSTYEQNLVSQEQELKKSGCTEIYTDKLSAKDIKRPQLEELLNYLRKGDILVFTKLDRLARSTKDLLGIAERAQDSANLIFNNLFLPFVIISLIQTKLCPLVFNFYLLPMLDDQTLHSLQTNK